MQVHNKNNNSSSLTITSLIIRYKNRVTVTCHRCFKHYEIYLSKYNRILAKGYNFYCSAQCQKRRKGQLRYYDKFYFCSQCNKWILKQLSILKAKGTNGSSIFYKRKQNRYYCPICDDELRLKRRKNQLSK